MKKTRVLVLFDTDSDPPASQDYKKELESSEEAEFDVARALIGKGHEVRFLGFKSDLDQLAQGLRAAPAQIDSTHEDLFHAFLHQSLKALADEKVLQSAHDCSDGGFAVALAESCFTGATHEEKLLGAVVTLPGEGRMDGRLFGEAQSRVIVSLRPADAAKVEETLKKFGVPFEKIGIVGSDILAIGKEVKVGVSRLSDLFFTSIEKMMA